MMKYLSKSKLLVRNNDQRLHIKGAIKKKKKKKLINKVTGKKFKYKM